MKIRNIFEPKNGKNKYVKLKCVDEEEQIYALEALCDFKIFDIQVNKGDVSGRIIIDSDTKLEVIGKCWLAYNTRLEFCGEYCALIGSYFYARKGKVIINNSSILDSYFCTDNISRYPKIEITDSDVMNSKFFIKFLYGNKITIRSSQVIACNFYTSSILNEKFYNIDVSNSLNLCEIKDSYIANVTTLKDVSVINSHVGYFYADRKVYIEGPFFVKDSKISFKSKKSYMKFGNMWHRNMRYLNKNLCAEKYTTVLATSSGDFYIKMYNINQENICMCYAKIEPEVLNLYNASNGINEQKSIEQDSIKQSNDTTSPNRDPQVENGNKNSQNNSTKSNAIDQNKSKNLNTQSSTDIINESSNAYVATESKQPIDPETERSNRLE